MNPIINCIGTFSGNTTVEALFMERLLIVIDSGYDFTAIVPVDVLHM